MSQIPSGVTQALWEAQQVVKKKQAELRAYRIAHALPCYTDKKGRLLSSASSCDLKKDLIPPAPILSTPLPPQTTTWLSFLPDIPEQKETIVPSKPKFPTHIPISPTFTTTILKKQLVPVTRIWLLLRLLDQKGQGWVDQTTAYASLTAPKQPLRACGRRQLRALLHEGESIFWEKKNGRIWLKSMLNLLHTLQIGRLRGRPINLPVAALTGKISHLKAHFYTTIHSSRPDKPISRTTISQLTGISRRTQHRYERQTNVQKKRNIAIGPAQTKEKQEQFAWQYKHALFTFTDYKGKLGPENICYFAWQLPNSYVGPHTLHSKGAQNRLNHQLQDLSLKGMAGNVQPIDYQKRYCAHGKEAWNNYTKQQQNEVYWLEKPSQKEQYWGVLA